MSNSTPLAFNKKQRSAKSFWTSIRLRSPERNHVLLAQPFYLGDPLLGRTAQPIDQRSILLRVPLKCTETEEAFHLLSNANIRATAQTIQKTSPSHTENVYNLSMTPMALNP